MPVVFMIYIFIYFFNKDFDNIKCYVIVFSNFMDFSIIYILLIFVATLNYRKSSNYFFLPLTEEEDSNFCTKYCLKKISIIYYSTSRNNNSCNTKSKRKILSSPEAMPYEDIYGGREIPVNEPI